MTFKLNPKEEDAIDFHLFTTLHRILSLKFRVLSQAIGEIQPAPNISKVERYIS
jgi:hypothetical protein